MSDFIRPSSVEVGQPASSADETELLLSYLNAQRRHVIGILDGLDDDALRRPVLPSGWSSLGLVQHLTVDVERFWFRGVLAGDQAVIDDRTSGDAWIVPPGVAGRDVLGAYQDEIDRANTIVKAIGLDAGFAWWPDDLFGEWRLDDVRDMILHVITETACHAGHLDAARELIDGTCWFVAPD